MRKLMLSRNGPSTRMIQRPSRMSTPVLMSWPAWLPRANASQAPNRQQHRSKVS